MKIFIWGTGNIANQMLTQCNAFDMYEIIGFIDNDPEKCGELFKERTIFQPDILKSIKPDRIVILTDYFKEIRQQIAEMFPDMLGLVESKNFFYKQVLLERYKNTTDSEIKDILAYIQKRDMQMFCYDFIDEYKEQKIDVEYDSKCGMFYVYHYDKKMYFARYLNTREKVRDYYQALLAEQDYRSPHRYLTSDFKINEGDIVVDVGTAEGNFSLEAVEKASRIYIVEAEETWIEALKETFKEYSEKIVLIKKFVTSVNMGKYATLDQLIHEPVNFIKMDIEGNEWDGLLGAEKLINQSGKLKCAICSYHSDFDEILIKDILRKYKMTYSTTPGYVWWPFSTDQGCISTRLRRGVVRGMK